MDYSFDSAFIAAVARLVIVAAVAGIAVVRIIGIGEELAYRELHFAEDGAGIVIIAGLAVFFGQTEVTCGKHELDFTFHTDDREDTDGDIDIVHADTVHKIAVEA